MYSRLHHRCGCRMFHGCTISYLSGPCWEGEQTPPAKGPQSLRGSRTHHPTHRHRDSFLARLPASRLPPTIHACTAAGAGLQPCPIVLVTSLLRTLKPLPITQNKFQTTYHSLLRLSRSWSGPAPLAPSGLLSARPRSFIPASTSTLTISSASNPPPRSLLTSFSTTLVSAQRAPFQFTLHLPSMRIPLLLPVLMPSLGFFIFFTTRITWNYLIHLFPCLLFAHKSRDLIASTWAPAGYPVAPSNPLLNTGANRPASTNPNIPKIPIPSFPWVFLHFFLKITQSELTCLSAPYTQKSPIQKPAPASSQLYCPHISPEPHSSVKWGSWPCPYTHPLCQEVSSSSYSLLLLPSDLTHPQSCSNVTTSHAVPFLAAAMISSVLTWHDLFHHWDISILRLPILSFVSLASSCLLDYKFLASRD